MTEVKENRSNIKILEYFGIPRIRIYGLSIFNFVGTFFLTFLLTRIDFIARYFTWLELSLLSIPLAVLAHHFLGEPTPLVLKVRSSQTLQCFMVLLACIGIFKHFVFYFLTALLVLAANLT